MDKEKDHDDDKTKLKVDSVDQSQNAIQRTVKNPLPHKTSGPNVEVTLTAKVTDVPVVSNLVDKCVEIRPKETEIKNLEEKNLNNTKSSEVLAVRNTSPKSSNLASRYILPNAGLLANPLTTLMTALPAVATTGSTPTVSNLLSQASPYYYLIKIKPPTENVQLPKSVPGTPKPSGSLPCNYVYAMPVSTTVSSPNLLGVVPQTMLGSEVGVPVASNSELLDSKTSIKTQDGADTDNKVDGESKEKSKDELKMVVKNEKMSHSSIYNNPKSQELTGGGTGDKKLEDFDDSDMSLGAQLLLNLSTQHVHHPGTTVSNNQHINPTIKGNGKALVGGNNQFPFQNLIFQVSQPVKIEPPDDWSECSGNNTLSSSVSVKQEKPNTEHNVTVPVPIPASVTQFNALPSGSVTKDTTLLSHYATVLKGQGHLRQVANSSLPQPVSQIIEEHALASQNLPHGK